MKLGYYPGCSLHATAREFDSSLRALAPKLDLELTELEDWSCCGATSAHATNHLLSIALAARNLSLAKAQGHEALLAPCAACYSRLATADRELRAEPTLRARVGEVLGAPLAPTARVRNVAEVLRELIPAITTARTKPLTGLKVACYYGCLLVRPPIPGGDDAECPTYLEEVVSATGATPVAWHARLDCCGGGFALSRTGSVLRLGRKILGDAQAAGADALAVACPMCQSNLDLRQKAIMKRQEAPRALPILFITQLVGLALGLGEDELGLGRHFVDPRPLVGRLALPAPAPAQKEA
jgi:heterodisulfide reductase subunit B